MKCLGPRAATGIVAVLAFALGGCTGAPSGQSGGATYKPLLHPSHETFTQAAADRMVQASQTRLAPVYAPLAEFLVERYSLSDQKGIGIDLGSGPGTLIVELARRTKLHWVNADINTHFFAGFYHRAAEAGMGRRVSAIFADAHALPFRDNYADIVVSRGTFPFWNDQPRAFAEIHRVLKPGGVAFVGRGLSPNLPVDVARKVRSKGRGGPPYEPDETAEDLRRIMASIGVKDFRVLRPKPPGSDGISYGVWVEWRK
jgi:SAM-dependent methyltransferase